MYRQINFRLFWDTQIIYCFFYKRGNSIYDFRDTAHLGRRGERQTDVAVYVEVCI